MKMFPILIDYRGTAGPCPSEIPWEAIAPYHKMARVNHGQTLERLSERGGLSPIEAYCVMTGRKLADLNEFPDELQREACAFLDRVSKDQLWEKLRTTELQNESYRKALKYIWDLCGEDYRSQPDHVMLHRLEVDIMTVCENEIHRPNDAVICAGCGGTGHANGNMDAAPMSCEFCDGGGEVKTNGK